MKTSQARLDWREGRRRRAWELKQLGGKHTAIAAAVGVTSGAVSQWLTRARAEGVAEGRRAHPASGRPPTLPAEQRAQLPAVLDRGAAASGFGGQVWTCKRVGAVIRRTCGVTSDPAHVGRLVHPLGYRVQRPSARATQRDEAAVRGGWERRWPALKNKPTTRTGALSGEISRDALCSPITCGPGRAVGRPRCCGVRSPGSTARPSGR